MAELQAHQMERQYHQACGDMSWSLDRAPGSDEVTVYGSLLTAFFPFGNTQDARRSTTPGFAQKLALL